MNQVKIFASQMAQIFEKYKNAYVMMKLSNIHVQSSHHTKKSL